MYLGRRALALTKFPTRRLNANGLVEVSNHEAPPRIRLWLTEMYCLLYYAHNSRMPISPHDLKMYSAGVTSSSLSALFTISQK